VRSAKAQGSTEIRPRNDRRAAAGPQVEQMAIVGDDQVGFTVNCTFENAIVVGIGGDKVKGGFRDDDIS
jgi:hypothetical protein